MECLPGLWANALQSCVRFWVYGDKLHIRYNYDRSSVATGQNVMDLVDEGKSLDAGPSGPAARPALENLLTGTGSLYSFRSGGEGEIRPLAVRLVPHLRGRPRRSA